MHICVLNTYWKFHEDIFWNKKVISIYIVVYLEVSTSIVYFISKAKVTRGCTIKIYDKRDDFDFDIVNFPSLNGDIPISPSYGTYLSQLIRFARVCNKVEDFNDRNSIISRKLLKQGFLYHKLRKTFAKFYNSILI